MNDNSEFKNDQLFIVRDIRIFNFHSHKFYGFINNEGSLVVDFRFNLAKEFQDGLSLVYFPGQHKYGFINVNGVVSYIEKSYSEVNSFSEGLALVYSTIMKEGTLIYAYGFINKQFKETIPLIYDEARSFKCGLAAVKNYDLGEKWGFIDKTGKQVIPFIYDQVGDFNDGLAFVKLKNEIEGQKRHQYLCGFINLKGEIKIPLLYDDATSFSEGLAGVGKRDVNGEIKYGFINNQGSLIMQYKYNVVGLFSGGIARVYEPSYAKSSIYINKKGNPIVPDKPSHIREIDNSGVFFVEMSERSINKYSLVDNQGNQLTSNYYNDISSFVEGLALVSVAIEETQSYQFGIINKDGQEIMPCKYDDIEYFRDGIAAVCLDGKWDLINKSGENITKQKYDQIYFVNCKGHIISIPQYRKLLEVSLFIENNYSFSYAGYCYVSKDGKFGIIDVSGNEIIPCINEYLSLIDPASYLLSFKRNGKWGLIQLDGAEIVSPTYLHINHFSDGLAACYDGNGWGFINQYGSVVIPCKYLEVDSFHYGLAAIRIGDLWGYINQSGKVVIKPSFLAAERFYKDYPEGFCAKVRKWDGKSPEYNGYLINEKGKIKEQLY